jgi:hypothetical protein
MLSFIPTPEFGLKSFSVFFHPNVSVISMQTVFLVLSPDLLRQQSLFPQVGNIYDQKVSDVSGLYLLSGVAGETHMSVKSRRIDDLVDEARNHGPAGTQNFVIDFVFVAFGFTGVELDFVDLIARLVFVWQGLLAGSDRPIANREDCDKRKTGPHSLVHALRVYSSFSPKRHQWSGYITQHEHL